jgi:hypothetical protein
MATRRISERRFLLRPDRNINNIVEFCIGLAAAKHRERGQSIKKIGEAGKGVRVLSGKGVRVLRKSARPGKGGKGERGQSIKKID